MSGGRIAESDRLAIRELVDDDRDALAAVFCDPRVMRFSDAGAQAPAFVDAWIARQREQYQTTEGLGSWAIAESSTAQVLGYVGLNRSPGRCAADEAELGLRLAHAYWNRGYATEAAQAVIKMIAESRAIRRVIAIVDPQNTASIRFLVKLGMAYQMSVMLPGYSHPDHIYAVALQSG